MIKKVHDAIVRKGYVLAITLAFVMLASSAAIAQIQDKSGNLMLDTDEVMKTGSTDVVPGIMQLSGDFEVRRPIGELFGRTSWPNPDVNFLPNGERIPAGDLNGDGSNDLIMHFTGRPDPRDSDPTTMADRTLVYLSGSEQDEPDYIFYEILYPAGDLNGDGKSSLISRDIFGSPSLYTLGDSGFDAVPLTLDHDLPTGQFINAFLINNDLDGSGFMDMVFTITASGYPAGARQFYLMSGAASESDFELRTYDFADLIPSSERPMTAPRIFDTFSHDGGVYLIASARTTTSPWERYSVILAIDGEKNVDFIQALQFAEISITADHPTFSARFESDGPPYLVLSSESYPNQKAFFHPLSAEEELLFSEEPVVLHDLQVWPAGDIGNDGTMKFIARETTDGPLRLAEVASTTTGGLSFLDELPGQDTGTTYVMPRFQIYWYGDLTGNGTDDHIIEYTNAANALTGYLRIFSGSDEISFESEALDLEQYGPRIAYDVYAVGDVTGNGFDDFVIYYLNFPLPNMLVFHEGGSNWGSPAFTLTLDPGAFVFDVVGGRFLDAERRDLVVLKADRPDPNVNFFESDLAIYQGGGIPSGSPIRSVKKEDVYPGISSTLNNVLTIIANAGDVNNSGLDDLLVATAMISDPSLGPLPAVLYYGGSGFLAGAPDASMGFPDEDLRGIGGSLVGLGDVNGDGIDDFAIGNIQQGFTSDFQRFGVRGGGRVHVYFGRDSATEFTDPDITLKPDTVSMASGNNMWLLGMSEIATGDFNGNGLRGIAVKPLTHQVGTNQTEGVPGVHIFNGDVAGSQPDQLLPLHAGIMGLTTPEYPFLAISARMEMQGIPDLTSNGRDELLMIGGLNSTNAVLHFGRDRFSDMPDIVFEAPNSAFTMGAAGSFINRQFRAAIGDFNGDGKLNFMVVQRDDRNLPDTPVYMYELGRPGGVQVQVTKTEPIGSTGGTIEDEETGTKVVIPADATEDEVEIEVGTFTVVPEGAEVSGVMIYLGPPGTTFSEPVEITVSYDPDNLPDGVENEEDLVLLRYDESTSEWEELPSVVNTTDKTVTGTTMRFSGFGAGAIKSAVNIKREEAQLPAQVQLHQNYPNPFNPLTVIGFTLPADAEVRLEVYNILGERVAVLADERRAAGTHQVSFNASRLSSGVYLYRLTTGDKVQTRKMMLIK